MIRRPPRSTRTDTLFPYTTLFRSLAPQAARAEIVAVIAGIEYACLFHQPAILQRRQYLPDIFVQEAAEAEIARDGTAHLARAVGMILVVDGYPVIADLGVGFVRAPCRERVRKDV